MPTPEHNLAAVADELGEALLTIKRMMLRNGILHTNLGECPDPSQPSARDDGCITCKMIMRAERALDFANTTLETARPPARK